VGGQIPPPPPPYGGGGGGGGDGGGGGGGGDDGGGGAFDGGGSFRGLVTVEPLVCSGLGAGADAANPSAQDELRNFDLNEWGSVSIDTDHDDAGYGDSSLWPLIRPAGRLGDDQAVVGFSFTAPVGPPRRTSGIR